MWMMSICACKIARICVCVCLPWRQVCDLVPSVELQMWGICNCVTINILLLCACWPLFFFQKKTLLRISQQTEYNKVQLESTMGSIYTTRRNNSKTNKKQKKPSKTHAALIPNKTETNPNLHHLYSSKRTLFSAIPTYLHPMYNIGGHQ